MNKILALLAMTLTLGSLSAADTRVFEMRIYYAAPGKLEALHARFRDHTTKLFEKNGITNIGYWVPEGVNSQGKLVYVIAYPSREESKKRWQAFLNDPDWKKAFAASEKEGKLVAKIESHFMAATDYSPEIKPSAAAPRVFEFRDYTASPGNLAALNARFRNHTVALFEKHGIKNLFYWNLTPDQKIEIEVEMEADKKLLYLLAHKSREAAVESFKNFRDDAAWGKARAESEKKAGGSLTASKDGVISLFLKPTDYSPTK